MNPSPDDFHDQRTRAQPGPSPSEANPATPTPDQRADASQVDWHEQVTRLDRSLPGLPPGRRLGRYEILSEEAHGGMGIVYRAHDPQSGQVVALKVLTTDPALTPPAIRQRFDREARTIQQLVHPHIVPVHEVGLSGGRRYIAMTLMTGGTLERLRKTLTADRRRAVALVAKVARAVDYAHQRGIIHRDLKLTNVLLDAAGEPFVADYGLAKIDDDESGLTFPGQMMGTPAYMAPEQAGGQHAQVSPATDVWALGVILYELLTGQRPFLREQGGVLQQILTRPPPRPRDLRPEIPEALEQICLRCLEKAPERRYQRAADLAADCERWLAGQPMLRSRRRLPMTLLAMAGLLVLAAVIPAALMAWGRQARGGSRLRVDFPWQNLLRDPAAVERFRWRVNTTGLPEPKVVNGRLDLDTGPRGEALLEVLPEPGAESYQFVVRFQAPQLTGEENIGLYFGCQETPLEVGHEQLFQNLILFRAPDRPRHVAAFLTTERIFRLPQPAPGFTGRTQTTHVLNSMQAVPGAHPVAVHAAHLLMGQVEPKQIRCWWNGVDFGTVDTARLVRQRQTMARSAPPLDPARLTAPTRGSLGLYLARGRAIFDLIALAPFDR